MTVRRMSRELSKVNIGTTANSTRGNARTHEVQTMTVFTPTDQTQIVVQFDGPTASPVAYLTPAGAVELVKGLLSNLADRLPRKDYELLAILKGAVAEIE